MKAERGRYPRTKIRTDLSIWMNSNDLTDVDAEDFGPYPDDVESSLELEGSLPCRRSVHFAR